ncbi:MAG: UvrB/UvrC motif-containing protein, partial [Bacteroidales bacterium]|nr:UvrB/UvrC motif-containing protein [Bacteroidales bacterium]
FDVLIGVNLLREGLDLPEVSLVAILDADKEGFLRSDKSLIQTIGRAARNANSKAILYADKITGSMQRAMDVNEKNRRKQAKYNKDNNITPTQIKREVSDIIGQAAVLEEVEKNAKLPPTDIRYYESDMDVTKVGEGDIIYKNEKDKQKAIKSLTKKMKDAAMELDFKAAAKYRDEINKLKQ